MNSDDSIGDKTRPRFGNRFLTNENDVFKHNAWDQVDWTEEQLAEVDEKIKCNSAHRVDDDSKSKYLLKADEYWDKFYQTHQDKFFKDRHWLFTEFPELLSNDVNVIFEIGCGVGNTIFPLLALRENPETMIYCCDFSPVAIDLLKSNNSFDESRCKPFVCDVTQDQLSLPFEESSLDVIVSIFTLSAIPPKSIPETIKKLSRYLKPGGLFLFRDYGKYDLAQVRFKKGSCMDDNFYVRGDGTMAYFFTPEEVGKLFVDSGLEKVSLITDKRLQVNRGKQLKMYRVWIQAKYRKPD
ncbi:tRNA N(3)-methylcytidine methyltransferase METTL2-like [Panonychus citri]|uniref:tRNA N(3)-methylcytidine methyltransferase METTL2-like n=1 Tax=Panonychus citri TaxID=50023 RepID=UPI002307E159|nr:tRNA N(3)-methylcytidine methyltransferase METTL2-like [Panonychus citri]